MVETVPAHDASKTRSEECLDVPRREVEKRITTLFRRWPALDDRETRELRRLWDERIRRAKDAVG